MSEDGEAIRLGWLAMSEAREAGRVEWLPFVDAIRNCFLSPTVEARIALEAVRNYARAS